jgi:hypothetical protein
MPPDVRKGFVFPVRRIDDHRGYASALADDRIGGIAFSNIKEVTHGKAQPYRTSGGRAANHSSETCCFIVRKK